MLYEIYKQSLPSRNKQRASFGFFRSDYFTTSHKPQNVHKMVEINCISVSFPSFVKKIENFYRCSAFQNTFIF